MQLFFSLFRSMRAVKCLINISRLERARWSKAATEKNRDRSHSTKIRLRICVKQHLKNHIHAVDLESKNISAAGRGATKFLKRKERLSNITKVCISGSVRTNDHIANRISITIDFQ